MSDNDWSLWTEPQPNKEVIEEPILDNESPDMSSLTQIDCLCEYEIDSSLHLFYFQRTDIFESSLSEVEELHRKVIKSEFSSQWFQNRIKQFNVRESHMSSHSEVL